MVSMFLFLIVLYLRQMADATNGKAWRGVAWQDGRWWLVPVVNTFFCYRFMACGYCCCRFDISLPFVVFLLEWQRTFIFVFFQTNWRVKGNQLIVYIAFHWAQCNDIVIPYLKGEFPLHQARVLPVITMKAVIATVSFLWHSGKWAYVRIPIVSLRILI